MAEFCLQCFNELFEKDAAVEDVILSDDLELCENCGEWKPVVIRLKEPSVLQIFLRLFFP